MSRGIITNTGEITRWGLRTGSVQRYYDAISKKTVKLYAENRGTLDDPMYFYVVEFIDRDGTTERTEHEALQQARQKFKELKRASKVKLSGGLY